MSSDCTQNLYCRIDFSLASLSCLWARNVELHTSQRQWLGSLTCRCISRGLLQTVQSDWIAYITTAKKKPATKESTHVTWTRTLVVVYFFAVGFIFTFINTYKRRLNISLFQARSEMGGGQNFKMKFFVSGASWGGRTWKKWTKYILPEKIFLKKGHFDKIFAILPAPPLAPRYGPVVIWCEKWQTFS